MRMIIPRTVEFTVSSQIILMLALLLTTDPIGQRIHNVLLSFCGMGHLSSLALGGSLGDPWGIRGHFGYKSDML